MTHSFPPRRSSDLVAVSVDRSVDRQMDLIVLRRLKAQTQPAARQHIRLEDLATVGAYTAHSGESDHAPALGELPALLHLQGDHVLVPVTPGFLAAQVAAGAETAEIHARHLPHRAKPRD